MQSCLLPRPFVNNATADRSFLEMKSAQHLWSLRILLPDLSETNFAAHHITPQLFFIRGQNWRLSRLHLKYIQTGFNAHKCLTTANRHIASICCSWFCCKQCRLDVLISRVNTVTRSHKTSQRQNDLKYHSFKTTASFTFSLFKIKRAWTCLLILNSIIEMIFPCFGHRGQSFHSDQWCYCLLGTTAAVI